MEIEVVRVYMMESEHHLKAVLKILHDKVKVRHVTVFRGIEGFEVGGKLHSASVMSLSLNLPITVEFFDQPETVKKAVEQIQEILEKRYIIKFNAESL